MLFKDVRIVTPNEVIEKGFIEIETDRIKDFGQITKPIDGVSLKGLTVMSGFIDMHIHGTASDDFMDANALGIKRISLNLLKEGTTSFLATTMTQDVKSINKALRVIGHTSCNHAKLLGVHLEGPFINKAYKGAQNENYIIKGTKELFDQFQQESNQLIKLVTLAPEVQDEAFLKYLVDQNIIVSMGHSASNSEDFKHAYNLGIKRVTHCFNAMPQIHHRELGLTGMALLTDDCMCEAIADGIHLSYDTLKLLHKVKQDNITLVTDSIRAKGLKDGVYDLGGQEVKVKDKIAYTTDNALAGSTLFMNQALKNMNDYVEKDLRVLTKYLSLNPAKQLGLTDIGEIKKGNIADLVFLDDQFNVVKTMVNGEILYEKTK
ncbi:N-acetylglucosamine-6-phosphate deacetylase [Liberiplasma polymorphum]|uniref:N-acetylglucosamine-6-phosphate deacetylase n=1 Tax=Liberiplasma polymorphum TaxID=3374570 RepID=UPI003772256E